jgi:hypothetical protein
MTFSECSRDEVIILRSGSFVLIFTFAVMALMACAEDNEGAGAGFEQGFADIDATIAAEAGHVDPSLLTPEADGTFSMAETATPVPSATPIPEPTSTPAPTNTPAPTFEEIYRDDVIAAMHSYFAAYHTRSQSALDSVVTAATRAEGNNSVEQMQENSFMGRSWSDYPDIENVEVTHLQCDEVLCKIWYSATSVPPVENPVMGKDFPFEFESSGFFRRVNGVFLHDFSRETVTDEWDSTHRE